MSDGETNAGRPRQAELDERIKSSAVAILGELGFTGLSVNRICQRAGIPRPTFYRRWPSAVSALVSAFNDRFDNALLADTGDAQRDLIDMAVRIRDRYDDTVIRTCLPALYEARRVAPELIEPIMEAQRARQRTNIATLSQALEVQAKNPMLKPFEIIFVLTATIHQGYLAGRPVADDFLERLVTTLLR